MLGGGFWGYLISASLVNHLVLELSASPLNDNLGSLVALRPDEEVNSKHCLPGYL